MLTNEVVNTNGYRFLEAQELADRGLPVFPTHTLKDGVCTCRNRDCSSPGKHPAVKGGFFAATDDLEQIKDWGRTFSGAGIATPTGIANPYKLVVIDADTEEMVEACRKEFGREPDVYTRNGAHWYFRHPQNGKITSGPIWEGVDRKAEGGYVVIPPSPGKRWAAGMPNFTDLPELPRYFAEMPLLGRVNNTGTAAGAGDTIPDGQRNATLTSFAGSMRRPGMEPAEIDAALQEINRNRCKPPLDPEEVSRIAASVGQYEPTAQLPRFPNTTSGQLNHRKNPVAISFSTGGRPEPRRWVVENVLPERFPTTLYGDSGKAKSFVAAHLGQAIADPGSAEWMGYPVQAGPVLYLDFEMDEIEQHRRAYDIAAGRGETAPPDDFLYMECVEFTPDAVFNTAYDLCVDRGVKLVIIDSMGMAIEGDSETSSDTNAFYRNYINPLRSLGVAILVIDHQAKKQKGEIYENKDIFGSTYKKANSRNVFQINGDWRGNELRAMLRHTKSNLGPQLDKIHLGITFEGGRVTLGRLESGDATTTTADLIVLHLKDYGPATPQDIADALALEYQDVRNRLGEMKGKRVEDAGREGRRKLWKVIQPPDELPTEDTREPGQLGSSPKLTDEPGPEAA